jgi:site-specific DNA recombinase
MRDIMENIKNIEIKAGLYIRVSTSQQVDKDSLKTQEERLIAHCHSKDIKNFEIYRDAGVSAKNVERENLKRLMDDIKKGLINRVFVTKLDRITRSIKDLFKLIEYFDKYDVKFESIDNNIDTSNSHGRFMQNLLALLAQLEREVTAERVSIDMHHRASQGKWNGGVVPYGYTTFQYFIKHNESKYTSNDHLYSDAVKVCPIEKKLYIDEKESKIIKFIFETYSKNNSVRKTTHLINESGTLTRNGSLWATSSIDRILSNPIYVGNISYGKRKTNVQTGKLKTRSKKEWTIVKGNQEGIIDCELFNTVQEMLLSKKGKPTKSDHTYLLGGILRCKKCGGRMNGYTFKKKNGKEYLYYKCSNNQQKGNVACKGQSIPLNQLEEFIISKLFEYSKNNQFLTDKRKMIEIFQNNNKMDSITNTVENYKSKEIKLNQKKERLLDKLEEGVINDADFKVRYDKVYNEISEIRDKIFVLTSNFDNAVENISIINSSFDELMKIDYNWENLDNVGKKMRIGSIVKDIYVDENEVVLNLYMDFNNVYNMDRDSLLQRT